MYYKIHMNSSDASNAQFVLLLFLVFIINCCWPPTSSSSSSEDSSSLNSMTTSLPSSSISVLVFFFFGLGGGGGGFHIMGCQQREPSSGVGTNSTNKTFLLIFFLCVEFNKLKRNETFFNNKFRGVTGRWGRQAWNRKLTCWKFR